MQVGQYLGGDALPLDLCFVVSYLRVVAKLHQRVAIERDCNTFGESKHVLSSFLVLRFARITLATVLIVRACVLSSSHCLAAKPRGTKFAHVNKLETSRRTHPTYLTTAS